ncbi:HAD family hydrolase, partial [bacterium]|nr:HAD family hydrolase [bacterium]
MTFFIDLDGPLLDVSDKYHRVYKAVVEELGGVALPKETYWKLKRQKTDLAVILEHSGLPSSTGAVYKTARLERIETPQFLHYDRLQPGAVKTLSKLCGKHDLFLVTLRAFAKVLGHELERLRLTPFFREILSAPGAPQKRHMTKVALIRSLGDVSSDEGIIVGDTETDIAAGKELSLTT